LLTDQQLPGFLRAVIDEQVSIFEKPRVVQVRSDVPDTTLIPIENPSSWLRIPDVICVFVDMKGSTQLSATTKDKSTAGVYQLFTGTAVRLFDEVEAPYIDVRGDGVFALFNSDEPHRALAAAVTFQTFASLVFAPKAKELTGLSVAAHIGIDQKTVLVRKLGLKRHADRTDRQNEVWAGKPVNMASKLAAMASGGEMYVSDRFYGRLKHDRARYSCGCVNGVPSEKRTLLWSATSVQDDPKFDFDIAHRLTSFWCATHGKEYCTSLLEADS
jgi:class 3 adenylate cyclase